MTQQNLFELKPNTMTFDAFLNHLKQEIDLMQRNALFENVKVAPGAWWDMVLTFVAAGGSELRGWAEAEVQRKLA